MSPCRGVVPSPGFAGQFTYSRNMLGKKQLYKCELHNLKHILSPGSVVVKQAFVRLSELVCLVSVSVLQLLSIFDYE